MKIMTVSLVEQLVPGFPSMVSFVAKPVVNVMMQHQARFKGVKSSNSFARNGSLCTTSLKKKMQIAVHVEVVVSG